MPPSASVRPSPGPRLHSSAAPIPRPPAGSRVPRGRIDVEPALSRIAAVGVRRAAIAAAAGNPRVPIPRRAAPLPRRLGGPPPGPFGTPTDRGIAPKTTGRVCHLARVPPPLAQVTRPSTRVGDLQRTPATAAAQQTGKQRCTTLRRGPREICKHRGGLSDLGDVLLMLLPTNISGETALFQYLPGICRHGPSPPHEFSLCGPFHDRLRAAQRVGPGVDRILQHPQQAFVIGGQPLHLVRIIAVGHVGQQLLVLQVPLTEFQRAGRLPEFLEQAVQAVLHTHIRMLRKSLAADLDVAGSNGGEDLAAAGFVPPAAQHAVAEGAQLVLGQCSLDAQEDMVVGVVRIVDFVFVGQQDLGEHAIPEQELPGGVVACPAGDFDGQDDARAVLDDMLGQFPIGMSAASGTGGSALFFLQQEDPFRGPAEFLGASAGRVAAGCFRGCCESAHHCFVERRRWQGVGDAGVQWVGS